MDYVSLYFIRLYMLYIPIWNAESFFVKFSLHSVGPETIDRGAFEA